MVGLAVLLVLSAAVCALALRLGFHQRLPLLLFNDLRVSGLVDFAARRYRHRILVELEEPLGWRVPGDPHDPRPRLWSARRIRHVVARVAAILTRRLSLAPGDRVVIYKANDFDIFLFSLAITRAGGISVPVNGK